MSDEIIYEHGKNFFTIEEILKEIKNEIIGAVVKHDEKILIIGEINHLGGICNCCSFDYENTIKLKLIKYLKDEDFNEL